MDLSLAGKTVLVTGGASNIGRGMVLAFAKEDANVVIIDIDEKQGEKVAAEANALGGSGRIVMIKTDITKSSEVKATVSEVLKQFKRIDVLVNGVGWDEVRLFIDTEPGFWNKVIELNYISMLNCCHAVLPMMIERKSGCIVTISSDAAKIGEYMESVYSGCKAATIALSKTIAKEVGRFGIRANVVCPTITIPESPNFISKASMWQTASWTEEQKEKIKKNYPLRRLGKIEDIADAVLFLSSDRASYVTGQTLSVDGGYTMI